LSEVDNELSANHIASLKYQSIPLLYFQMRFDNFLSAE